MNSFWKRLWTEINLDNLIYNFQYVKNSVPQGTKVCCVVKANAYGHHAPRVAKHLEEAGADCFAVSNIEEAIQLRNAKINAPILILGYTPTDCVSSLAKYDISQCVYSYEYARELSNSARANGCTLKIHIKVDTGMGRIGFQYNEDLSVCSQIFDVCQMPNLLPEGIFTHFAVSDMGQSGEDFTKRQYDKFIHIVNTMADIGIKFELCHCSNSAAAVDYPDFALNMVRAGVVLYGLLPSSYMAHAPSLKPVMSLKTVVSHVKTVNKGDTISYGCDFVADKEMKIATVPMGYADGFLRANAKNDIPMIINGKKAFIVGRICMDQLMLDVSDIPDVRMGDEVTVFGDGACSVDEYASANGTINYEIICTVGRRVPRVFIQDGKRDGIHLGVLDITID